METPKEQRIKKKVSSMNLKDSILLSPLQKYKKYGELIRQIPLQISY